MRRPVKNRNIVTGDVKYGSEKVEKFINHIMLDGKKQTARKVVYKAFERIMKEAKTENPLEVFDLALKNAAPMVEVRSRRVGGANYQVPVEVRPERRAYLGMTAIIKAARAGKGTDMEKRLADELILASKEEGIAVKKKEDTHRMAEANKAFSHFRF